LTQSMLVQLPLSSIDQLLDLTHVNYVYKNTLAEDPREATTQTKTERT
jgi:hypothetical protein